MLKIEAWKYLRNVSVITMLTALIIILSIILNKSVSFIIVIFWPLIITLIVVLILSIFTFVFSLFKIKNGKRDE